MMYAIGSAISSIKRGKWKPVFKFVLDKKFRDDVKYIFYIRKNKTGREAATIPADRLVRSHDILYPEWVSKLVNDLSKGDTLKPIEVVFHHGYFIVVDGNHRLEAYLQYGREEPVPIITLT